VATSGQAETAQGRGNALVASATLGIRSESSGGGQSHIGMPLIEVSRGKHAGHAMIRHNLALVVSGWGQAGIRQGRFPTGKSIWASVGSCNEPHLTTATHIPRPKERRQK